MGRGSGIVPIRHTFTKRGFAVRKLCEGTKCGLSSKRRAVLCPHSQSEPRGWFTRSGELSRRTRGLWAPFGTWCRRRTRSCSRQAAAALVPATGPWVTQRSKRDGRWASPFSLESTQARALSLWMMQVWGWRTGRAFSPHVEALDRRLMSIGSCLKPNSNNVDPLVNGFSQIYFAVKYI